MSTTRIETMLGDTAIAVHPDDPRYVSHISMICQSPRCLKLCLMPLTCSNMKRFDGKAMSSRMWKGIGWKIDSVTGLENSIGGLLTFGYYL